ncbi:MAG: leucine-rich repeat protein [Treponema sp.]
MTNVVKTGKYGAAVPAPVPVQKNFSFKGCTPAQPPPLVFPAADMEYTAQWQINQYIITFSADGTLANGMLKAEVDGSEITSGKPVEHGKTVTFTATSHSGYEVYKWTVDGAAVTSSTANTHTITVTKAAEVKVRFERPHISVAYANLENYLQTIASSTEVNYIEVTDLSAADLQSNGAEESPLGRKLKNNSSKKVSLKLPKTVDGLTDMSLCFNECTNLVSVLEIPNEVTIMTSWFDGCKSLTHVPEIPNKVTSMEGCFSDCECLEQAPIIPNGVTNMNDCFQGCINLSRVQAIPDSVTSMENCFFDCKRLEQAPTIPNSVTNMKNCFCSCKSLTHAPEIPNKVTSMENCFSYCERLEQAPTIPNNVTNMNSCFQGCINLNRVPAIPNSITNMDGCFQGCSNLSQVPAIPNKVTNMNSCFHGCSNLTSVILKCNYDSGGFSQVFTDCPKLSSIKVSQTYYDNYTAPTALSTMGISGANVTEQKAKFERLANLNL